MTTYSIREAKARLSEILRDLDSGEEVLITRRGRPCGRLTGVDADADDKPSLATLRGALSQLPDADYQDFQDIKGVWEAGERLPDAASGAQMVSRSRFVADTHALWWYFRSPERLGVAADAVFQLAATGNATVVVPAIVVAEFYYLSAKLGSPLEPAALLEALDSVSGIELSELGRAQLERLDRFPEVPEMHDRLIAAEAEALGALVVTRDEVLTASERVATVW